MVLTRHTAVVGPTPDPRIRYLAPSGESWVSIARSNGIRPATFASRINRGWDPQDAATRPVRPSQALPLAPSGQYWVSIARDNGVHPATFHPRIQAGLTHAQAATTPTNRLPQSPDGERWRDVALRHAISRSTFYTRVANGWDPADAATTPPRRQTPQPLRGRPWQLTSHNCLLCTRAARGSIAVNGQFDAAGLKESGGGRGTGATQLRPGGDGCITNACPPRSIGLGATVHTADSFSWWRLS